MTTSLILLGIFAFLLLAYFKKGYWAWVVAAAFFLVALNAAGVNPVIFKILFYLVAVVAVVMGVPFLRRYLVSSTLMRLVAKTLPTIGETERIALEAGTVWWDADLFAGNPDWKKLLNFKVQKLSKEEQAFMTGPVEKLCAMLDDHDIAQKRDLPPDVWDFIKKHKFFGMIIPKKHGGLGFSAALHSQVVAKISSRSVTAGVTVMVPNSLGPGELLLRYGTPAQKKYYLPRLADGRDIPCFALTEPHAGSDAANGRSFGVVCKGSWKGKQVVGIKLTFNKRYITLAPVATVVGLAFRLYDPDHLLGDQEDIGITCALLPRETKGLEIGNRHDPMGTPFQNGPVRGQDVFIPMDYIIGGKAQLGNGWRMLMECLSAGRGISLPSQATGAAEFSTRVTSAYALVREQFGLPIGRFEGVRERLARVAGHAYFMDATRRMTVGAIDAGEHPSVASAIAKAYITEGGRQCVDDGMDILGGAAICRGPRNVLARPYTAIPVGITVEGANILTRSLIVFGQGAMRCHPFLQEEVNALQTGDVTQFDRAFFGHVNHFICTGVRAFFLALTGGQLVSAPCPHNARYYQQLSRYAAALAFIADVGLATLGGALKRKEHLSGRYADAFAWLYIASAVLKRAHDEGHKKTQQPLVDWALTHALLEIETGLTEVLRNLPNRPAAWVTRFLTFPLGAWRQQPTERQIEAVADVLLDPASGIRDDLTRNVYAPAGQKPGIEGLEHAYTKVLAAQEARNKIMQALKQKHLKKGLWEEMATAAKAEKILTPAECKAVLDAEAARDEAIQVDDFAPRAYNSLK
jgi:acyl-CoA dehydrogenase